MSRHAAHHDPSAAPPHLGKRGSTLPRLAGTEPDRVIDEQLGVLADALDALSAHIAIIDQDGNIVAVNGAWRRFAQLNGGDLHGFNVGDNYLSVCENASGECGDDAISMAAGIKTVIRGNSSEFYLQYECHTPSGPGWYQVRVRPFRTGNASLERFVVAHENITEAKLAEEELRSSQAQLSHLVRLGTMGELTAGIAHELNQPLGAVANYASGCKRRLTSVDGVNPSILEALDEIAGQANRAGEIIRRLRNFVRSSEPSTSRIDLRDAIGEAVGLLAYDAKLRGIELTTSFAGDTPPVYGDSIQLQQVFLNLVKNAIEAISDENKRRHANGSSAGSITIRTRIGDPQHVVVEVEDDGPGVREEDAPRVFDAFFTTKESGLGLGLSLSASIIDAHRGKLGVARNDLGGATFRITLPASSMRSTPVTRPELEVGDD